MPENSNISIFSLTVASLIKNALGFLRGGLFQQSAWWFPEAFGGLWGPVKPHYFSDGFLGRRASIQ